MALVVNHNLMAMNAARNLGSIYSNLANSTQRLSSGLRVNSAADDAAGLAIRELMRADISVLNQGVRNASDAISMIQTAEGAMQVIDEKLIRMKELAEQAATGTYTTAQREIMNSEYQAMAAEIDRIANATDFNGVKLLNGSLGYTHSGSGMKIHFGTGNDAAEDYYFVKIDDMRATYESGLRVGNSDLQDTLRTTALNATSPGNAFDQGQGTSSATDGVLAIRYTTNFNAENASASSWNIYGYVDVDASRDSVNSVVAEINKGAQAQGTMTFDGTFTTASSSIGAQSLTVNGMVFSFASGGATDIGTFDGNTGTGIIQLTELGSTTTMAWETAAYFNTFKSVGIFAVADGATVHFVSREFGEDGNEIDTAITGSSISVSQDHLSGGGNNAVSATAYYDEANGDYELQLQMNRGGEKYQVQIFNTSSTFGILATDVMAGGINGLATGFWGGQLAQTNTHTSVLSNFSITDETSEWFQAQNGSGTTDWNGADILTQSAAQLALSAMDDAIKQKDTSRANLGALQNRLENTITNLQIQAENLQAAESRISDVDVATEMTEFTRNNILAQAAVAMLAQANSLPQLALSLLG